MSFVTSTGRPVIAVQFDPDGDSLGILYDNETAVREWSLEPLRQQLAQLSLDW